MFCSLYSAIPENKDKLKSKPKLFTGHSKGLDHLFNGVDYISADQTLDLEPKGLDCEEIHYLEKLAKRGECPLCDNPEALKFLKAKGIEYDPVAKIDLSKFQRAGKRRAEDTGESSSGRPSKASIGMPLDKLVGSSDQMEGVEYGASQARGRERSRAEGTRAEGTRAEGKRAVSDPDESRLASMDWE